MFPDLIYVAICLHCESHEGRVHEAYDPPIASLKIRVVMLTVSSGKINLKRNSAEAFASKRVDALTGLLFRPTPSKPNPSKT